jgi:hypothetical protein
MSSHLSKKPLDFPQRISAAVESWRNLGRQVTLLAVMLLGVVIIASAVAYAYTIPAKIVAVVTAAAGSIVGTGLFCLALPKLTSIRVASLEKAQEAIDQLLAKTRSLELERDNLEREVRRLESMRVSTDRLKGVLKLALLEYDGMIKDFCHQELSLVPSDDIWGGEEMHEYVGVVEASFKAFLGVDLQKVKLRQEGDTRIVISGISSEFQGLSSLAEEWKLKEVRVKKYGHPFKWGDAYKIVQDDPRLADLTIAQRRSLQERINSGIDFSNLDAAIKNMAREMLALLLSPLHKGLVFVDGDDPAGLPLLEFLEAHNKQIDSLTRVLEEQRSGLESRASRLLSAA